MSEIVGHQGNILPDSRPIIGHFMTVREMITKPIDESRTDYDHRGFAASSAMARYVANSLTSGHPNLGRRGPVCPFAAAAVAKDAISIAACLLDRPDEQQLIAEIWHIVLARFEPTRPQDDSPKDRLRSVVIVFPNVDLAEGSRLIESIQRALKPQFVARGLMIGEFYPDCPASGLHNADFRPFDAPVVSLAVRRMTEFDEPFMLDNPANLSAFRHYFPKTPTMPAIENSNPAALPEADALSVAEPLRLCPADVR